ncbi:GSCOCG00007620001-RA-CDS [Cotesia congregata]|nr:GSCOCG00007620001-RA-CDS [Cotesia congregata]
MVRCNVKGCLRRPEIDKDHSFFLWPKEERIRQQWKDFAQYKGFSNSLRICSDHFERRYIKKNTPPKRLLVSNAVPTLLPPDNILKMPKNMSKPPLTNSTAKNLLVNVNNDEVIFMNVRL